MRTYPKDDIDQQALEKLNASEWQVECLKYNPEYVFWGVGEDYMTGDSKSNGWGGSVTVPSWKTFGWELDELNELVNFYFRLDRANETCLVCNGSGYNSGTHEISETFYDFDKTDNRWCDQITQDEADMLWEKGRLSSFKVKPTAEQVNDWERRKTLGHDAINRSYLIEHRAKRLGVWGYCPMCHGDCITYTAPAATLALMLWMIHPRKGASRGVEIKLIEQDDLPAVFAYLHKAAERNANRFAGLPK